MAFFVTDLHLELLIFEKLVNYSYITAVSPLVQRENMPANPSASVSLKERSIILLCHILYLNLQRCSVRYRIFFLKHSVITISYFGTIFLIVYISDALFSQL